ncbi:MAG: hypothetical protein GY719_35760 [bacterium]|nr:hypothetical protein [bacterium]
MIDTAELIVAFAWTLGANGFLITGNAPEDLPARWLEPVAEHTWVAFHDRDDWAMAFYLPDELAPAGGESKPGRVVLYAPYYLAPDGLRDTGDMPVDVAEHYFHALLESAIKGSAYAASVSPRAHELMLDVPESRRLQAYLAAAGDFGAHALSIANELHRAARRQAAAGKDLCELIDHPATLFGSWRRSFAHGLYHGRYLPPATPENAASEWATSRVALEEEDKLRFTRDVLGSSWTGDPARDFTEMCGSVADVDPPNRRRR